LYLIDLSSGFSSTGLLAAIISVQKERAKFLFGEIELCMRAFKQYHERAMDIIGAFFEERNVESLCIDAAQIDIRKDIEKLNIRGYKERLNGFLSINADNQLSLFDFIIYFSIVLLLEKNAGLLEVKATFPRIGASSPSKAIEFFKNQRCVIDPASKAVPVLLAVIASYYFKPFHDTILCILRDVRDVQDPFDPATLIRVFEVEEEITDQEDRDFIAVLETTIDDSTPEIISDAMKRILNDGALDYTISPVMMKKGRIGHHLEVLCNRDQADKVTRNIFNTTSTFGIRKSMVERVKLRRRLISFQSSYGPIMVKEGYIGEKLVKIAPEFDDLVRLSEEKQIAPYMLYQLIVGELNKTLE
jgi:hypothetical protein